MMNDNAFSLVAPSLCSPLFYLLNDGMSKNRNPKYKHPWMMLAVNESLIMKLKSRWNCKNLWRELKRRPCERWAQNWSLNRFKSINLHLLLLFVCVYRFILSDIIFLFCYRRLKTKKLNVPNSSRSMSISLLYVQCLFSKLRSQCAYRLNSLTKDLIAGMPEACTILVNFSHFPPSDSSGILFHWRMN